MCSDKWSCTRAASLYHEGLSADPALAWHSPHSVRRKREKRRTRIVMKALIRKVMHSEWPGEERASAWLVGCCQAGRDSERETARGDTRQKDWAEMFLRGAVSLPMNRWEDSLCFQDCSGLRLRLWSWQKLLAVKLLCADIQYQYTQVNVLQSRLSSGLYHPPLPPNKQLGPGQK